MTQDSRLTQVLGLVGWLALAFVAAAVGGFAAADAPTFYAQLVVNALWSWFFFAWRSGAGAFVAIVLLLGLIVATMVAFYKIRRAAGLLFVPYLAWVCLATALTWTVWQSNPTLL